MCKDNNTFPEEIFPEEVFPQEIFTPVVFPRSAVSQKEKDQITKEFNNEDTSRRV